MSQNSENSTVENLAKLGLIAGIAAYTFWGLFPIYFKLTASVPPMELLAHRIAWSVPLGALIIMFRRQWSDVWRALTNIKVLAFLSFASLLLAINWGLYIWAIQQDQIFQASLGYYITPLLYVMIGVVFLGETLRKLQIFAIALAALGVAILTILGGQLPWIALTLAVSFTIYGVIRKQIDVGAMPGLFIETLVLFLPAIAYIIYLIHQGNLVFISSGADIKALLLLAGPVTVLPLLAFAFAARHLKLSTLGFLQFIGPTLQFFIGMLYGEALSTPHLVCFVFIWSAVALFIIDAIRNTRKPKT